MYYKTGIPVGMEPEFLASEKVVAFTHTVVATGISTDEYGRKIAHKGCLISDSGKVVKVTVAAEGGAVSFSEEPAGILMASQEVTHGSQPGSLLVEGYVIGERLNLGVDYTEAVGDKIREALPEIKIR